MVRLEKQVANEYVTWQTPIHFMLVSSTKQSCSARSSRGRWQVQCKKRWEVYSVSEWCSVDVVCQPLLGECRMALVRRLPAPTDIEPRSQESCLLGDSRQHGTCHIYLHLPLFFERAANRPDHSLHRLTRSVDDPVARRASNNTVHDDPPRFIFSLLSVCSMTRSDSSGAGSLSDFTILSTQTPTQSHEAMPPAFDISILPSTSCEPPLCTPFVAPSLAANGANVFPSSS